MLISNGLILNPATDTREVLDLRIAEDGMVSEMEKHLEPQNNEEVLDANGCYVFPGLIDLHVHFRDPGQTAKEDLYSGSRAAVAGGYTGVFAMPNTLPVADSPEAISDVQSRSNEIGLLSVYQVGAITKGMKGQELSDISAMVQAGCKAFSEDGKSVMNSKMLRHAMREFARLSVPVFSHCEDIDLVEGGVMNAGEKAASFGLPGITNAVENIIAARDMMLAEETGARLHLCHCSTKESVDFLRDAKKKGLKVTGEVCPHHFLLTEDDIPGPDHGEYKMNPPLRSKADRDALIEGLRTNALDVISTDHAPHTAEEKSKGFLGSPFGIVGIETVLPLTYTYLVLKDVLTPMQMVEKMSYNPARIAGIPGGDISPGHVANITIFDPAAKGQIRSEHFYSKGKSMPYEGMPVSGQVRYTIYQGKISFPLRKE